MAGTQPLKVVSLDGCADQYVLALVPRSQILGLSDRARLPDSYFRERAATVRRIQPRLVGHRDVSPGPGRKRPVSRWERFVNEPART